MASQAGLELDEMGAQISATKDGFREVTTGIVEDAGIDTAFIEADPARASKMMEIARKMVLSNDPAGLRDLT
ncbi:MAG: hypothetical protein ABJL72_15645 [Roseobacter sp.]